jgi:inner membrane protein
MTGRTHDLAAFTALSLVLTAMPVHQLTLATAGTALLANMIGGIAPDIDQPTAPFWRSLPIGGVVGRMFDPLLGGHRFLSHSIVGMAFFGAGWYYILEFLKPSLHSIDTTVVWWAFMIGFASHLVMDTITREGVPWLLPIPWRIGIPPIKAFRVQTGGFVEQFIIFPGLALANIYIYYSHYTMILDLLHRHLK